LAWWDLPPTEPGHTRRHHRRSRMTARPRRWGAGAARPHPGCRSKSIPVCSELPTDARMLAGRSAGPRDEAKQFGCRLEVSSCPRRASEAQPPRLVFSSETTVAITPPSAACPEPREGACPERSEGSHYRRPGLGSFVLLTLQ